MMVTAGLAVEARPRKITQSGNSCSAVRRTFTHDNCFWMEGHQRVGVGRVDRAARHGPPSGRRISRLHNGILSRAGVDDFTVDTSAGSVTGIAVSVIRAAGWQWPPDCRTVPSGDPPVGKTEMLGDGLFPGLDLTVRQVVVVDDNLIVDAQGCGPLGRCPQRERPATATTPLFSRVAVSHESGRSGARRSSGPAPLHEVTTPRPTDCPPEAADGTGSVGPGATGTRYRRSNPARPNIWRLSSLSSLIRLTRPSTTPEFQGWERPAMTASRVAVQAEGGRVRPAAACRAEWS